MKIHIRVEVHSSAVREPGLDRQEGRRLHDVGLALPDFERAPSDAQEGNLPEDVGVEETLVTCFLPVVGQPPPRTTSATSERL